MLNKGNDYDLPGVVDEASRPKPNQVHPHLPSQLQEEDGVLEPRVNNRIGDHGLTRTEEQGPMP